MTRPYRMIGLVDPSGLSVGFFVPLFGAARTNAPFVQTIADDGTISGFERYEVPWAERFDAPGRIARVGDPSVHAFAFGPDDVAVVGNEEERTALLKRVDDPVLRRRPLLAMELASFLGREELRLDLAKRIYQSMADTSEQIADRWRDLSILTSDLRRKLRRRPERFAASLSETVVASVRGNLVEVCGVDISPTVEQIESLRDTVRSVLRALSPLYRTPSAGWRIQVRGEERRARKSRPDAAVLLASARARRLGSAAPWLGVPNLEPFFESGTAFTRMVEETSVPLFVVYDHDDPDVMRKAIGDWTVREMHGIEIGRSARRPEADEARQPWHATGVPDVGLRNEARREGSGGVAAVKLAVAVELDRRGSEMTGRPRLEVLLRTSGSTPSAASWAALYDRAWTMGFAPWRSHLVVGAPTVEADADGPDAARVVEALFWRSRQITGRFVGTTLAATRTGAALLVDAAPRGEGDDDRHQETIERLLERLSWERGDRDQSAGVVFRGRQKRIRVRVAPSAKRAARWNGPATPTGDLRSVEDVVVTCDATPGVVVGQLAATGELAVNVRDLVVVDAQDATVLTLLGAQLLRLVTTLPSRSRSRFLGLLVSQALRYGRVELSDPSRITQVAEDPDIGTDVHLIVRSVRMRGRDVVAEVGLLVAETSAATSSPRWREVERHVMTVDTRRVTLSDTGAAFGASTNRRDVEGAGP